MPLFFSSEYTCTTPVRSGWARNASAHSWISCSTFSCTAAGGSFFGPISFTSSCTKSFWATSTCSGLPQFLTHVSSTVSVYMMTV